MDSSTKTSKKVDAISRTFYSKPPKAVIVQLKRFDHTQEGTVKVDQPMGVRSIYLPVKSGAAQDSPVKKVKYVPVTTVSHKGNAQDGHYYNLIKSKNNSLDKVKSPWSYHSDESIHNLRPTHIDTILAKQSYMILYVPERTFGQDSP